MRNQRPEDPQRTWIPSVPPGQVEEELLERADVVISGRKPRKFYVSTFLNFLAN